MGTDGMAESPARIVAVDGATAWAEVQPGPACGGCSATARAACPQAHEAGAGRTPGLRRVGLVNDFQARVGESVIVGLPDHTLLRAAATAYGLPVAGLVGLPLAVAAFGGGDVWAAGAAVIGLGAGLLAARRAARRLNARGALRPVFVRRADPPSTTAP